MRVIPSITDTSPAITEAMLVETSVDENETQWLVGTTYAEGDERRGTGDYAHRMFRSLAGGNTGNAVTDPEWWEDIGPTNRWAMFDLLRNTGTTDSSPIVVTISPGQRVNSIALAGLVADTVTIEVESASEIVYSREIDLRSRNSTTATEYCFGPFTYRTATARFDLPPFSDATVTVTIERSSGDVTCGALILGMYVWIGDVEPSAEDDAQNFSTIDRTFDGEAVLIQRRTVPKTDQTLWADKALVNKIRALRTRTNAIPAMWCGLHDEEHDYFEALLILGIWTGFKIGLEHETLAHISLQLEEV